MTSTELETLHLALFWMFVIYVDSVAISSSGYIGECDVDVIYVMLPNLSCFIEDLK